MLKVITYNTHLFGSTVVATEKFEDEERASAIIDHLLKEANDFDLIGLTEVWSDKVKKEISQKLKSKYPHSFFNKTSPLEIGAGLLLLSKHPLINPGFEKFNKSNGADALSQKGICHAFIELPEEKGNALIALTHTQSGESKGDKSARQSNIKQITKRLTALSPDSTMVVLMGDLNVIGEDENGISTSEYDIVLVQEMLKNKLSDTFRNTFPDAKKNPGFTFDGTKNKLVGQFDEAEKSVRQRLDYIFSTAQPNAVEVPGTIRYTSPSLKKELDCSDHYPLSCSLVLPKGGKKITSNSTTITFETSDQRGAGTDSNIFVVLHGLKSDSQEFRMQNFDDQNGHSDLFERGDANKFVIRHEGGLGMLYAVTIRSDGRFPGSDWRLSSLRVKHEEQGQVLNNDYVTINSWIDAETKFINLPVPEVTIIGQEALLGTDETRLLHGDAVVISKNLEEGGFQMGDFQQTFSPSILMADSRESIDETTGLVLLSTPSETHGIKGNFNQTIVNGIFERVQNLLQKDLKAESTYDSQFPIFFRADNQLERFKSLWLKHGAKVNIKVGETPLQLSAFHSIQFLLALLEEQNN